METYAKNVSDKTKNACAVVLMRNMLLKYSERHNLSFEMAMPQFGKSSTYESLFDFDTAIWKEGPDYVMELYEEELQSKPDK